MTGPPARIWPHSPTSRNQTDEHYEPAPREDDWDFRRFAPIPLCDFARELLGLYEPPLRAKSTLMKMKQVAAILRELLGDDASTAGLNPALVARVIEGRPAGESPRTTHAILAYLRAACSYAKSQGYIRTSPFDFRKKWVRLGPARQGKHHSLDEIRRVLDLLASEVREREGWSRWRSRRLLAMASVFAYCGLRKLEGLRLHAEDVDLEGRMIFLVERSARLKTEKSRSRCRCPTPWSRSCGSGWGTGWIDSRASPRRNATGCSPA